MEELDGIEDGWRTPGGGGGGGRGRTAGHTNLDLAAAAAAVAGSMRASDMAFISGNELWKLAGWERGQLAHLASLRRMRGKGDSDAFTRNRSVNFGCTI